MIESFWQCKSMCVVCKYKRSDKAHKSIHSATAMKAVDN